MNKTLFAETRRFVLDRMRKLLESGVQKLPTDRELSGEVLASYATIRLVMKDLEQDGFVRRIRGSGTYLTPEAATLLQEASWPRLRLFSSPTSGAPDIDYGVWMITEIKRAARQACRRVLHTQVRTHDEFLAGLEQLAEPGDAVVYLPPSESFTMRQLGELGRHDELPLIVVDCEFGNVNISNITSDNRRGGMLAAQALLENGYTHPMILLSEPMLLQSSMRLQGFREIAELSGVVPEVIDCEIRAEDDRDGLTYIKMLAALRAGRRPDAVFAISDIGALAVCRAIRDFGLDPGRDIAVLGFDGIPAGRKHNPPWATIAQPVEEISREVFQMLERWKPGMHEQRLLSPEYHPGATLWNIKEKLA